MSNRMKSGIVIGLTLLLGFALGMLVTSTLHRRRFENLRRLQHPGGIAAHILHEARPDREQRQQLRGILKRYEPRLRDMRRTHQEEMRQVLDSLRSELGDVLTPDQLRRLRRRPPDMPPPGVEGDHRRRGPRRGMRGRQPRLPPQPGPQR